MFFSDGPVTDFAAAQAVLDAVGKTIVSTFTFDVAQIQSAG